MLDLSLIGKTAFVGGGSRGIGAACARALADAGASVILAARTAAVLDATRATLSEEYGQSHRSIVVDNSRPGELAAAVRALLADISAVHILVNNSGGPPPGQAIDADPDAFRAAFEQHLVCNQILAAAFAPGMKVSGYGRIVNVISTSVKQPIPGLGVSNTIRGAVANWAKTLSMELGPHGITVNNVLPGATRTERLDDIVRRRAERAGVTPDAIADGLRVEIPLRRFAEPEEVAAAVVFLASPAAGYVTGINLPVDGGRTGNL